MTTISLKDDIANGNIANVRETLRAHPHLVNCTLHHEELVEQEGYVRPRNGRWEESPLNFAARRDQVGVVKVLLEHDADCNQLSSLYTRSVYGDIDTQYDSTPLYRACMLSSNNSNLETTEALLDAGAKVYIPCYTRDLKDGTIIRSSVYSAASLPCRRLLLNRGYDANTIENYGLTLLDYAIIRRNTEDMKILVAAGATAENLTKESLDSVIKSCGGDVSKLSQVFDILMCAGADINTQDPNGLAPHHQLVRSPDLYRVLVKFGADEMLLTNGGNTALTICCQDFMAHTYIPQLIDATSNQEVFRSRSRRGWYPFQLVALCCPEDDSYAYEKTTLTASYLLLCADPSVLALACASGTSGPSRRSGTSPTSETSPTSGTSPTSETSPTSGTSPPTGTSPTSETSPTPRSRLAIFIADMHDALFRPCCS